MKPNPLDLRSILTVTDPEPQYIVDGLLYEGQIITVAGEPGVGKTFLHHVMSICVATGKPVLDLKTVCGPVLYFDEENGRLDLRQYLRWAWRGLGRPDIAGLQTNLNIEHFSLTAQGKLRYRYMREVAAQVKPVMIVVDTASPACDIQDENDNSEATRAIKELRTVKDVAGPRCGMIVLKHARFSHAKRDKRTIRGAKTWLGELDGIIFHVASAGAPRNDGLRNSALVPHKVRAFGLRDEIRIVPEWTGSSVEKGLILIPR